MEFDKYELAVALRHHFFVYIMKTKLEPLRKISMEPYTLKHEFEIQQGTHVIFFEMELTIKYPHSRLISNDLVCPSSNKGGENKIIQHQ